MFVIVDGKPRIFMYIFLGFYEIFEAARWEFLSVEASDDVIAERSSEAKDAVKAGKDFSWTDALGRVFMAVFIAEWGDRTQVSLGRNMAKSMKNPSVG